MVNSKVNFKKPNLTINDQTTHKIVSETKWISQSKLESR